MMTRLAAWAILPLSILGSAVRCQAGDESYELVPLVRSVESPSPMTGIVFWDTSPHKASDAIALEYFYARYDDCVTADGRRDWSKLDARLDAVAARGHQAIVRFHDTYPGRESTVPVHIKAMPGYSETRAESEGKATSFPDWSHPAWKAFVLEFLEEFVKRYDRDPRLAFLQVGFGLWAEYHIYDGPFELGKTFPDFEFQAKFLKGMNAWSSELPWMISVDAADGKVTPIRMSPELKSLRFGLFDDSLLCRQHAEVNELNWNFFGRDRFGISPAGGEFSYYTRDDQRLALAPEGPHGESFEKAAARFRLTFVIGDGQPRYQPMERIRAAGKACGYRFRIEKFETKLGSSRVTIRNSGVAPIYRSAFVAVDGLRGSFDLKILMPGQSRTVEIASGGKNSKLTIECDHLVKGQEIPFEAGQ